MSGYPSAVRPDGHFQAFSASLASTDPALARLIATEEARNQTAVNLIASESYCPRATLDAEASLLTTKNVYGYPGNRGVAGCGVFDEIERLAQERACRLFGAEHANVQALSSTIGNIAVFRALVPPGGSVLAFDEAAGGHHSHGAPYHLSGRDFSIHRFGADEGRLGIDIDALARLAREHRPALIVAGSTSFPRTVDFAALAEIAREVDARLFADIAHVSGLVAAGLHPNPVNVADVTTTSTHKTFCGPRTGGLVLSRREVGEAIDRELFPGLQGAPGAHIVAARAVLFEIAGTPAFRELMRAVVNNACRFADALLQEGLELYLGGTDTHMVVIDLRRHDVDAQALERRLELHDLIINRVALAPLPDASGTSALRVGVTAMTIRGLPPEGFEELASILRRLILQNDEEYNDEIAARLAEIATSYPIPEAFVPTWATNQLEREHDRTTDTT
ncbi:serine hydroxymethyltransferase [Roseovarius sp.]|uniref:serine hydroxymethyltransferase n=1 Tax=Roseovarius sp. TaxID=1486281 RepID=UPI0035676D3A